MLKSNAIELLMDNVTSYYKITDFLGGRTYEDNGKEIALGIVQFTNTNNVCQKIVAVVREDSCQTVSNCDVEGYLIDCEMGIESLTNQL